MRYSTTITITVDDRHVSFLLSIVYQALFVALISLFTLMSIDDVKPLKKLPKITELNLKTIEITQKPKRIRITRRASFSNSKVRSTKKSTSLSSMLGNLSQKTSSKKSHKKKMVNTINQKGKDLKNMINKKSAKSSMKIAGVTNFEDFTFTDDPTHKKTAKNKKKQYVNMESVKMALNEIHSDYKNCYERSLLVDKNLSVIAQFSVRVVKSKVKGAKVKFSGKGSRKSKNHLKGCLINASKGMDFGVKSVTRTLKFKFALKS